MKHGSSGPYRKGHWSVEEDIRLIQFVRKYGEGRWSKLAKAAGLQRCGKSCRLRWVNYLRPDIKRGHISEEEERLIIRLHATLGNRWSLIALHLPGRSDNEIKNYWRSHIKKKLKGEDISTIDNQSSQIDSLSSENSQNIEDYNTTLIDGACYNMALSFDGCSNGMDSQESAIDFEASNGVANKYIHNSFKNLKSMIGGDINMAPSAYIYSGFGNLEKVDEPNQLNETTSEDTNNTLPMLTHAPSPICSYNLVEDSSHISIDNTKENLHPSCVGLQVDSWDFGVVRQHSSPIYDLNENQQQPTILQDCEAPWDFETMQPIIEIQNAQYMSMENNYGFEIWENYLFPPSESSLRFGPERKQCT